jgi:hypothetical protein
MVNMLLPGFTVNAEIREQEKVETRAGIEPALLLGGLTSSLLSVEVCLE